MKVSPRWIALAAASSLACRYDLAKLRSADAGVPIDMTAPPMDVPVPPMDLPAPPMDVPRDTTPPRDTMPRPSRSGTCNTHRVTDLNQGVGSFSGTLVVNGNTMTDMPVESTLQQVAIDNCPSAGSDGTPERVFRYQMQRGNRLVATTNGAPCSGSFDTVLYAIDTCDTPDAGVTNFRACSDDDVVMCNCTGSTNCENVRSTVEVNFLQPGDVVYLVVDGYQSQSGPFRLSVAENGLRPVAPPMASLGNHCTCPSLTATMAFPVSGGFPNRGLDTTATFNAVGAQVTGTRNVGFNTISAVAGGFRIGANTIGQPGVCSTMKVTMDLVIENNVAASFQVTNAQEPGTTVQLMYSTFSPITVPTSHAVSIAYRLRAIDPPQCVGSFEIDASAPNQLTLYGMM